MPFSQGRKERKFLSKMDKNKYTMHSASFIEYIFFQVAEFFGEKAGKF
jgi:hypothetical protein